MKKEPSPTQDKPMVMEVAATVDRIKMLEERKGGPSRAMLKSILLSVLHV
jgi:hypothetical protein